MTDVKNRERLGKRRQYGEKTDQWEQDSDKAQSMAAEAWQFPTVEYRASGIRL